MSRNRKECGKVTHKENTSNEIEVITKNQMGILELKSTKTEMTSSREAHQLI